MAHKSKIGGSQPPGNKKTGDCFGNPLQETRRSIPADELIHRLSHPIVLLNKSGSLYVAHIRLGALAVCLYGGDTPIDYKMPSGVIVEISGLEIPSYAVPKLYGPLNFKAPLSPIEKLEEIPILFGEQPSLEPPTAKERYEKLWPVSFRFFTDARILLTPNWLKALKHRSESDLSQLSRWAFMNARLHPDLFAAEFRSVPGFVEMSNPVVDVVPSTSIKATVIDLASRRKSRDETPPEK